MREGINQVNEISNLETSAVSTVTSIVFTVRKNVLASQEALLCAKAKRQQQSAQSERKSITRYGDEPVLVYF
jgi:hypothetical protein